LRWAKLVGIAKVKRYSHGMEKDRPLRQPYPGHVATNEKSGYPHDSMGAAKSQTGKQEAPNQTMRKNEKFERERTRPLGPTKEQKTRCSDSKKTDQGGELQEGSRTLYVQPQQRDYKEPKKPIGAGRKTDTPSFL